MLEARYLDVFSASLRERVLRQGARHGQLRRGSGHEEEYKSQRRESSFWKLAGAVRKK